MEPPPFGGGIKVKKMYKIKGMYDNRAAVRKIIYQAVLCAPCPRNGYIVFDFVTCEVKIFKALRDISVPRVGHYYPPVAPATGDSFIFSSGLIPLTNSCYVKVDNNMTIEEIVDIVVDLSQDAPLGTIGDL